jgi:hypothetical protein
VKADETLRLELENLDDAYEKIKVKLSTNEIDASKVLNNSFYKYYHSKLYMYVYTCRRMQNVLQ